MQEQHYQGLDEEALRSLDKHFEQKTKRIRELAEELGPNAKLRMFVPKKDYLKKTSL